MRNYANAALKKTESINTNLRGIIAMLVEDPHCLDGNPWRSELHVMAFAYLKVKEARTKNIGGAVLAPNSAEVISIQIKLENYKDAANDEAELVAAGKVANFVFEASEEKLRLIPDREKAVAFKNKVYKVFEDILLINHIKYSIIK